MKVKIDWDERYPEFHLADDKNFGIEVDITPKQAKKWRRVLSQYEDVQNEIEAARDAAIQDK